MLDRTTHNHYHNQPMLIEILAGIKTLLTGQVKLMALVVDLQTSVTNLTAVVTNIQTEVGVAVTDLTGQAGQIADLQTQLAAAEAKIAAGTIAPGDLDPIKAALDSLSTSLGATASNLQTAITPPAPATAAAPVVPIAVPSGS